MHCAPGRYQPQEAQTSCILCPNETFTESRGAQNVSQCAEGCPAGHWSPTALEPCHPCRKGQYQPQSRGTLCINCPGDYTTDTVGATQMFQCYEECERGTAGYSGREPFCDPCPLDAYQPLRGQEECKFQGHMMDPGIRFCNQTSFMCYNGGKCIDPKDMDSNVNCHCLPGFKGYNCEELDPDFCPEPYVCPNRAQGGEEPLKFWQYEDPCDSSPCENGGSCLNSNETNSYQCYCPLGYSGPLCGDLLTLCRGVPCIHGRCDNHGECLCDVGYAGAYCNKSVDPCWFGLNSKGCEPDNPMNPCLSQPCSLGSTCLPSTAGTYVCKCQPGSTGPHCSKPPRNTTLSDWAIFLGRVSQFNIFSDALPTSQIQSLANPAACNQSYHGDVISWTNALPYAFATKKSLCLDVNECWYPKLFPCSPPTDICVDMLGFYKCINPQSQRDPHRDMKIFVGIGVAGFVLLSIVVGAVLIRSKRRKNRHG
ncbi:sushi, von Willebrand factor type A, EGF and pentraxin domain containing 1, mRNA protein [Elysia marginata]|uniref:Sushi, von Willebrand factor type A, EGF and pentraxin domain containing 1, mRNA protein n=1 Tax=Elysia marginata TaxID=1093978 RepID=A0AAV4I6F3_9GAST|nr:sushi, von Willebrand factor type A, EGF and pentraxin domain containing 1, mRNA protein [Elysia marginata]